MAKSAERGDRGPELAPSTTWRALAGAVALCACAAACSSGPPRVPDPVGMIGGAAPQGGPAVRAPHIRKLWVPPRQKLLSVVIPQNESQVVGCTSGDLFVSRVVAYGPDGEKGRTCAVQTSRMAPGSGPDEVVCLDVPGNVAEVVRVPEARVVERSGDLGVDVVHANDLATIAGGWVAYCDRLCVLAASPIRLDRVYESPVGRVNCVRSIAGSTHVGVLGGTNRLAVMDIATGEVEWSVALPCKAVSYDLEFSARSAWIATKDDEVFLEVKLDSEAHEVVVHRTGLAGPTSLGLSRDGRTLAVVANSDSPDGQGPGTVPYRVIVYDLSNGALDEIGRADFVRNDAIQDVAVFSASRAVVLAGCAADAQIVEFD